MEEKHAEEKPVGVICGYRWGEGEVLLHNGPHICGLPNQHNAIRSNHVCGVLSCRHVLNISLVSDTTETLVVHKSGAKSSGNLPNYFRPPGHSFLMTAERFEHGNQKHEGGNNVYAEMNWLKAFHEKDHAFFIDRGTHAILHLVHEMQGIDDPDPGGNIGGMGWFLEALAYVKVNDPEFYKVIRGLKKPCE